MPPTHDFEGSFCPGLVLNSSKRRERIHSFGQRYYTSQFEEKVNRGPLFAPVVSIGYFHLKHLTSHLASQITMLLIRGMQYDVYIFLCPTGLVQCHFHQQLLLSSVLAQGWLSCLDSNRVLHKRLVDAGALRLRSRSACTLDKVTLASSSHLVSMDLSSTLCFCIAAGRSVRSIATAVICATLPVAYADPMSPAVRQTVYACVFNEPRGSWH